MDENTLSKDLWAASNLITGFAIVQTITFTYACAKTEFSDIINTFWLKAIIAILLTIVVLIEDLAVWWCSRKQTSLIEFDDNSIRADRIQMTMKRIIHQAAIGRIVIITLLLIPTLLALYARQLGGVPFK